MKTEQGVLNDMLGKARTAWQHKFGRPMLICKFLTSITTFLCFFAVFPGSSFIKILIIIGAPTVLIMMYDQIVDLAAAVKHYWSTWGVKALLLVPPIIIGILICFGASILGTITTFEKDLAKVAMESEGLVGKNSFIEKLEEATIEAIKGIHPQTTKEARELLNDERNRQDKRKKQISEETSILSIFKDPTKKNDLLLLGFMAVVFDVGFCIWRFLYTLALLQIQNPIPRKKDEATPKKIELPAETWEQIQALIDSGTLPALDGPPTKKKRRKKTPALPGPSSEITNELNLEPDVYKKVVLVLKEKGIENSGDSITAIVNDSSLYVELVINEAILREYELYPADFSGSDIMVSDVEFQAILDKAKNYREKKSLEDDSLKFARQVLKQMTNDRHRQVGKLLINGVKIREIAEKTGYSERSIRRIRSLLFPVNVL